MNGMMASMPGFPMPPGTFPPFFVPGHAMQPGGWSAPPDDRGGHGPIRRGGAQGGRSYRTGPYDRRPNGRPDGGRHRGSGGGRWGDGAAGGAAVGPREAVQGRSLKSYEDLDHVSGGGGSELNY